MSIFNHSNQHRHITQAKNPLLIFKLSLWIERVVFCTECKALDLTNSGWTCICYSFFHHEKNILHNLTHSTHLSSPIRLSPQWWSMSHTPRFVKKEVTLRLLLSFSLQPITMLLCGLVLHDTKASSEPRWHTAGVRRGSQSDSKLGMTDTVNVLKVDVKKTGYTQTIKHLKWTLQLQLLLCSFNFYIVPI